MAQLQFEFEDTGWQLTWRVRENPFSELRSILHALGVVADDAYVQSCLPYYTRLRRERTAADLAEFVRCATEQGLTVRDALAHASTHTNIWKAIEHAKRYWR